MVSHGDSWYAFGYRGIVFNLLFALYLWLGQPWLLEASRAASKGASNVVLGVLLVVVMVIEMVVLPRKIRDVQAHTNGSLPSALAALWLFHMFISIMLGMQIGIAFGLSSSSESSSWLLLAIFLKELYLGSWLLPAEANLIDMGLSFFRRKDKTHKPLTVRQALFVDLGLLVFSCVAYTAFWEASWLPILTIDPGTADASAFFALLLGGPLMVAMLVLPIRLPFVAEEIAAHQSQRGYIGIVVSFVALTVVALGPAFQGDTSPDKALQEPNEGTHFYLERRRNEARPSSPSSDHR